MNDVQELETGVKFLKKMQEAIGDLDADDQALLVSLSTFAAYEQWSDEIYTIAARLFMDYRACLRLMGKDAKAIGYQTSICLHLYVEPALTIRCGRMMEVLKNISSLHNPRGVLPFPMWRW
jgi:hypothetical protein